MAILVVEDKSDEKYLISNVTHVSLLSRFMFFRLEKFFSIIVIVI